jgi:signal transduction histidine kinase
MAGNIASDANRGVKHARQFLQLSKKQERSFTAVSLNQILTENAVLMRSLVGEDIDLQTILPSKTGLVSADSQEIIQLISTLITCSREALPLGGSIGIEISALDLDSPGKGYPSGMEAGIYICLKISADGCAVQPERRTGSIRSLLDRMGGWMLSTHTPQSGNVHTIYLPRIEVCARTAES